MKKQREHVRYLSTEEAAELCRMSPRTLRNLRSADEGPPSYSRGQGTRVVYREDELRAWLEGSSTTRGRGG
jgi:predicted DNA-binding transcriptional regulator AlpA